MLFSNTNNTIQYYQVIDAIHTRNKWQSSGLPIYSQAYHFLKPKMVII
jgi:hypothetical protein